MEILKLNNVSYSYNKKVNVLTNVNLTINAGEDIAIIGHNGSGKSTLGKLLISLLKPKEGTLSFNGTVIDYKNDTLIKEYATKMGVETLLDKEPSNLSGGQKQRVALAGILAMLPDVIVFDEALAMLDPKGKKEISNLIKEIKVSNPNLTIIRITHDLDEAFNSDKIIVLSQGKVMFNDTPREIFKHIDELKNLGLDIPFIVKFNKALKDEGLISEEDYNLHSLINKVCK